MKIAIVSDTHGNVAALRAVLADIEKRFPGIDIYDLGDLLDGGPRPAEVLELALPRYRGYIRGNHEDYQSIYLHQRAWEKRHHELWKLVPHGVKASGAKLQDFLNLQVPFLSLSPEVTLLHASLTSNAKVPSFLPDQGEELLPLPSIHQLRARHFYFMGHTHYPGIHKSGDGDIWINVGSVAYPFLGKDMTLGLRFNPRATWVLLELIDRGQISGVERSSDSPEASLSLVDLAILPKDPHSKIELAQKNQESSEIQETSKKPSIKVQFFVVSYDAFELINDWHESGALREGTPFSLAILAQSLWNQDLTYPIFKSAKSHEPEALSKHFRSELKRLRICENLLEQNIQPDFAKILDAIRKNL